MLFGKKKEKTNQKPFSYDTARQKPVLRCSICNGEQVAGLKDRSTGAFEEIMLIRNEKDLETFQAMVQTKDIPREY